jgi:hypothetical protein
MIVYVFISISGEITESLIDLFKRTALIDMRDTNDQRNDQRNLNDLHCVAVACGWWDWIDSW